MKKILLPGLLACALVQFTSCKEVIPEVNPSGGGAIATDTTYVAAVEAKQNRVVMIEEFTGVSCPPCPNGHAALKAINDANPGRVAIVGMQPYNVLQAYPVAENGDTITRHDNRSQKGTDIANAFGGLGVGIPTAIIDRQYNYNNSGSYFSNYSVWPSFVSSRLSVPTPLNITITNAVTGTVATIQVKVSFTEAVTTKQYMVVAITEDSVIDAQKNGLSIDTNYVHTHLLRDIITTGTTGTNFLGDRTSIEPGRVYQKTFIYNLNTAWNPNRCHIVAYVVKNETGGKDVEQAAVQALK